MRCVCQSARTHFHQQWEVVSLACSEWERKNVTRRLSNLPRCLKPEIKVTKTLGFWSKLTIDVVTCCNKLFKKNLNFPKPSLRNHRKMAYTGERQHCAAETQTLGFCRYHINNVACADVTHVGCSGLISLL